MPLAGELCKSDVGWPARAPGEGRREGNQGEGGGDRGGDGGSLGFQLFFQYGPIYLSQVLKFDVQRTGFAAAAPAFLSMCLKLIAGPLSDRVPFLSDRSRWPAASSRLAFLPDHSPVWSQIFFTGSIMASGLNCVGTQKSIQLISGRYSYLLLGVNHGPAC
ncbi:hypothetical protein M3Y99_01799900 [Aphelenchoides fujianensis]|nr:hypothetical protein M3Y99_01799900 [Aphelenchoides fujianensis]